MFKFNYTFKVVDAFGEELTVDIEVLASNGRIHEYNIKSIKRGDRETQSTDELVFLIDQQFKTIEPELIQIANQNKT